MHTGLPCQLLCPSVALLLPPGAQPSPQQQPLHAGREPGPGGVAPLLAAPPNRRVALQLEAGGEPLPALPAGRWPGAEGHTGPVLRLVLRCLESAAETRREPPGSALSPSPTATTPAWLLDGARAGGTPSESDSSWRTGSGLVSIAPPATEPLELQARRGTGKVGAAGSGGQRLALCHAQRRAGMGRRAGLCVPSRVGQFV